MAILIIKPPAAIQVELMDKDGSRKHEYFAFPQFIEALLNSSEWGKNWRTVQNAMEIDKACKNAEGNVFEISDRPYEMLKQVAENPEQGYLIHPLILRQIGSYFEAILDAKEKGAE